jgi:hypothetical protein
MDHDVDVRALVVRERAGGDRESGGEGDDRPSVGRVRPELPMWRNVLKIRRDLTAS